MRSAFPGEDILVEALRLKTRRASEWLYDNYANSLYGILLAMVKDREMAEDLLQQTFLKIWTSIELYDSTKGRLFTWMMAIARNIGKDSLKSKSYRQQLATRSVDDHLDYIELHHTVTMNTDVIGIAAQIKCLDRSDGDLLDLVYLQGYTQKEAAEKLHLPLGTVKTMCRRALLKIRAYCN